MSNKRCCNSKKTREKEKTFKNWAGRRIDFCTWLQYKVFCVTFNNSLTMAHFPFCIKCGLHFLTSLAVRIEALSQNELGAFWALFKTDTCSMQCSVDTGKFREHLICELRTWWPKMSVSYRTFRSDRKSNYHKSIYDLSDHLLLSIFQNSSEGLYFNISLYFLLLPTAT